MSSYILPLFEQASPCAQAQVPSTRPTEILDQFEAAVLKTMPASQIVCMRSRASALDIVLESLELPRGSWVAIAANAPACVEWALRKASLEPYRVDVDTESFTLSVDHLDQGISSKLGAVWVNHHDGVPADMDALIEFCEAYDIFLVEDGICAAGARYKGQPIGTFGHVGLLCCDGQTHVSIPGTPCVALLHDDELAVSVRTLVERYGEQMDEVQVELLHERLMELENAQNHSEQLVADYCYQLKDCSIVRIRTAPMDSEPVYSKLALECKDVARLAEYLAENGIDVATPQLLPDETYPIARGYAQQTLYVPCHSQMHVEDVRKVCASICAFDGVGCESESCALS